MRLVVSLGLLLSGLVVLLGLVYTVATAAGYGREWGLMALILTVFVGLMALALIWLAVLVIYVVVKGVRVYEDASRQ